MLLISTYVAQSPIEGLGVFAGEYVPRGSLIWSLNPKFDIFVHAAELDSLPPHMRGFIARYSYPHLEMPGYRVLDADNGRWLVYSTSPADSTEGGLAALADATLPRLYNRAFATDGPGTITQPGNHLIYVFQPSLTLTADDATRTYGAADPLFTFNATGFVTDDGVTDPGSILTGAQRYAQRAPWIGIFPGLAITLAVFAASFLGDAIRDALDPRLRH